MPGRTCPPGLAHEAFGSCLPRAWMGVGEREGARLTLCLNGEEFCKQGNTF